VADEGAIVAVGWWLRPCTGGETGPLWGGDEVCTSVCHRQRHQEVRDVRTDTAAEQKLRRHLQVRLVTARHS